MKTKYFIGLDVHKKTTAYAVRNENGNVLLEGECATLYLDLRVRLREYLPQTVIGVEASTSYYTLYQEFLKNGYDIKVANTLQMRKLIAKNDKLDALRLAEMLRLGTFPCSYIPEEKIRQMRDFVRLRHSFMEEKTRCNNRIQALVDREGLVMPSQKAFGKKWKHALMQYIGSGRASLTLREAFEHYTYLDRKVERLDQEMIGHAREHWGKEVGLVQSVTGFGKVLSCYVIADTLPIKRFASKRKLRRYVGVVPVSNKDTGDFVSKGHMPKTSSRNLLCWAFIQAANAACRGDTKLGKYYRKKKKQKGNSGMAKVALASTLSDIVYTVLTTGTPYQAGVEH